jgi:hypothetical protein
MRFTSRGLLVALVLVLALVTAAAGLLATQSAAAHGGKGKGQAALLRVAADYLDLTKPALVQELRSGKSLAQVAEARGKTRAGLVAALVDAVKATLDAKTRLTAEQKAAKLARAQASIERLVDRVGVRGGKKHRRLKGGLLRVAADYLQLEPAALAQRLREGSSLAEVAVALGKTRAGLKAALLDAVKAKLDRNTRLTAEQKAVALARADAQIERLLDQKRATRR